MRAGPLIPAIQLCCVMNFPVANPYNEYKNSILVLQAKKDSGVTGLFFFHRAQNISKEVFSVLSAFVFCSANRKNLSAIEAVTKVQKMQGQNIYLKNNTKREYKIVYWFYTLKTSNIITKHASEDPIVSSEECSGVPWRGVDCGRVSRGRVEGFPGWPPNFLLPYAHTLYELDGLHSVMRDCCMAWLTS